MIPLCGDFCARVPFLLYVADEVSPTLKPKQVITEMSLKLLVLGEKSTFGEKGSKV